MNLDDISVYLQVVASGSLSGAAQALRRPKASVSHQLKRLEDELGTQLFLRTSNRLTLNGPGRDFHAHALAIRRACDKAKDSALQSADDAAGEINIASASEFASNLVSPILLHFMREAPHLSVNVMTFQREILAEMREQLDCILYLGDPPVPQFSNMSARLLGRFRFGLYASGRYLSQMGPPSRPNDLLSHRLLGFHNGQSIETWDMTDGATEFSVRPDSRLMSNDYWIIKLGAVHDHGICFVPEFFAGQEVGAGLLRRVLPDWSSADLPVYALFWSHRFANPNLRLLLDTASAEFNSIETYLYSAGRRNDLASGD